MFRRNMASIETSVASSGKEKSGHLFARHARRWLLVRARVSRRSARSRFRIRATSARLIGTLLIWSARETNTIAMKRIDRRGSRIAGAKHTSHDTAEEGGHCSKRQVCRARARTARTGRLLAKREHRAPLHDLLVRELELRNELAERHQRRVRQLVPRQVERNEHTIQAQALRHNARWE